MCGISGFWASRPHATVGEKTVREMVDTLHSRGPDGDGTWWDPEVQVALGHRRLSILDLSEAGRQPMRSASGHLTLTYNGEIYNYRELQRDLERDDLCPPLRGGSDTEVLLAALEAWGVESTLERLNGMFAFALWDDRTRTLTLARDRMGIKPLYFGWTPTALVFGSELRALTAYPDFDPTLNLDALGFYFRTGYLPAPESIYRDVRKLEPGHLVTFRLPNERPAAARYWSLTEVARRAPRFTGTADAAITQLEALLSDAVQARMVADVPLGAFLSGGIDSATVVALMQASSARPVQTFTIGFNETKYNEANAAKEIAAHLGTDHTELYVSPQRAMDLISELADLYDEPFADSSQVPTTLVSRLARDHVTVALSGDGGDELFAGYRNYDYVPKLWGYNRRLPRPLRRLAGRALTQLSPDQWNHLNARVWGLVKRPPRPAFAGEKAHRIATVLGHETESALYNDVTSAWKRPTELLVRGRDTIRRDLPALHGRSMVERMMLRDATDYLHNDILTKVDRASMSVSLEVRVPILDHRVAEFAWSLPYELKHRDQTRKWLLRQVLYRHVPQALMDRPKQGFSIPVGEWLRGPLRSWAESLIGPDALAAQGVLHSAPIEAAWQRHLQGQNHPTTLWFVLMLQAWLQRYPHRLPST